MKKRFAAFLVLIGAVVALSFLRPPMAQEIRVLSVSIDTVSIEIPSARTNTAPVRVNGQWTSLDSDDGAGGATPDSVRYYFPHKHTNRIRRDCTLDSVRVRLLVGTTATSYTEARIQIWRRRNGNEFDYVGQTQNLIGTTGGIRAARISPPIQAKMGDYYVCMLRKTPGVTGGGSLFAIDNSDTTGIIKAVANVVPDSTAYDWYATATSATPAGSQKNMEVEFFSDTPPQVVAIGYSQIEGHSLVHSYVHDLSAVLDTFSTKDPSLVTTGWDHYFFNTLRPGTTWENAGIGGQYASEISVRAPRDVFELKPRIAIVHMGGNDTDSSEVYTYMSTFLDSCAARSIIPVVVSLTPMTAKTDAQMYWRDRVNKSLQVLCQTHAAGAIFVETDGILGKAYGSGPIGNRWDINTTGTTFDSGDGLHFTAAGQRAFARAINNALRFDVQR